jgi:3-isopropylmalate dehydrogenase
VSLAKFGTAKASSYNVAVLPGDGIGPEITRATIPVLESVARKCNFGLHFCEGDIGGAALDRHKDPFPDETAKLCHTSDSVLLACIGGHKWDKNSRDMRPETGLLRMRKSMGLFANLRPAKVRSQLVHASSLKPSVVEGVDLIVVRELTGGLYFGTPSGIEVDALGIRRAYNTAVYTELEIERIARVAMGITQARGGRVCSVDKANVLDVSQL